MENVVVHDFDTAPASDDIVLELLCEAVYECLRYDQREIVRQRSAEMWRAFLSRKNALVAEQEARERQAAVRNEENA